MNATFRRQKSLKWRRIDGRRCGRAGYLAEIRLGEGVEVIPRRHGFAVGAGAADCDEVAAAAAVQRDGLAEDIRTLADRTHDIVDFLLLVGGKIFDTVIGLVEGRAYEFGHAAVDDGEAPGSALLDIKHAADETTAWGYYAAAGLEMNYCPGGQAEMRTEGAEPGLEIGDGQVVGMLVIDSQTSAYIYVA